MISKSRSHPGSNWGNGGFADLSRGSGCSGVGEPTSENDTSGRDGACPESPRSGAQTERKRDLLDLEIEANGALGLALKPIERLLGEAYELGARAELARVEQLEAALDAWLDWDRTAEADTSGEILERARKLTALTGVGP